LAAYASLTQRTDPAAARDALQLQARRLERASQALLQRGVDPLADTILLASTVRPQPDPSGAEGSDDTIEEGGTSSTPARSLLRLPTLATGNQPSPLDVPWPPR
jgi:hypothetical protein